MAAMIPVGQKLTFGGEDEGRDMPVNANGLPKMRGKPKNVNDEDWQKVQSELGKMSSNSMTLNQLKNAGPNSLGNDPKMEMAWAEKAAKHAEAYFSVLRLMPDKKKVKLTKIDDEIYADFRKTFGKMKVGAVDEGALKSEFQKGKWRPFCNRYKGRPEVTDYNFGSLLRLNASGDYSDANTAIVPRIQFIAIEIARNREGLNAHITKDTHCPLAALSKAHATAGAASAAAAMGVLAQPTPLQAADVLAADQKQSAAAAAAHAAAAAPPAAAPAAAAAAAPAAGAGAGASNSK